MTKNEDPNLPTGRPPSSKFGDTEQYRLKKEPAGATSGGARLAHKTRDSRTCDVAKVFGLPANKGV